MFVNVLHVKMFYNIIGVIYIKCTLIFVAVRRNFVQNATSYFQMTDLLVKMLYMVTSQRYKLHRPTMSRSAGYLRHKSLFRPTVSVGQALLQYVTMRCFRK